MDVTEPASVLVPPGTASVLRALAGANTAFTVRQLARIAGVSHQRAGQVVERLAEHGLVMVEEQGPSKRCWLNRDHLAAPIVTALAQLRAQLFGLLIREIETWAERPVHASLFGSAARGDGGTGSDLDVLLIHRDQSGPEDPRWAAQLLESGQRIQRATGNPVAWFDLSLADLHRAVTANEPIVDQWRQDTIRLTGAELRDLLRGAA